MTPERWNLVEPLVAQALELEPAARAAFLDDSCGPDLPLRTEVERLLESVDRADGFLVAPHWTQGSEADSPTSPQPGQRVGAYRVLAELGRGGMGTVFKARRDDGTYDKEVALKVLRPGLGGPAPLERFRRERFILAQLEHPGIARLYDAGMTEDGTPFYVMEEVEGEPIDVHCRLHRVPPRRRIALMIDACEAIQAAHQRLIVHRDLKPSNLLVSHRGALRLVDFGIAKLLAPESFGLDETQTSLRPLTPRYASPEQLRGEAVSVASDLYSLSIVLYELLTGRHPFVEPGASPVAAIEAMLADSPRPPSQVVRPETAAEMGLSPTALTRVLRGDLDAILLKALRREPEQRYGTAAELAADLRRTLDHQPVLARRGSIQYRLGKFLHRHRLGASLGTLAVTALVAASVGLAFQATRLTAERNRVVVERDTARHAVAFMEDAFGGVLPERSLGETLTVATALERGAVRLRQDLADQPEIRADLATAIGRIYRSLGLYAEARPLLADAIEVLETTAPGTAELARAQLDLGRVETAAEHHEAARRNLLLALDIVDSLGRGDSALRAEVLHHYGAHLRRVSDLPAAEEALSEALRIRRARLGVDHLDTARTLSELGIVQGRSGRFRDSESTILESLRIQDRALPWNHPDREVNYTTLGISLGYQGKMEEAGEALAEAVRIHESLLPAEHPALLNSRHNYAVYLSNVGRADEAEVMFLDVLTVRKRVFEPGSPRLMESSMALAALYQSQGRLDEAAAHLEEHLGQLQVLASTGAAPGELAFRTAQLHDALARILAQRGDRAQAETSWSRVVEALTGSPELEEDLHGQSLRAIALLELGDVETARPLVETIFAAGLGHGPLLGLARRAGLIDPDPEPTAGG